MQYILAIDQGTTSSRSVLYDERGRRVAVAQQEFRQIFPRPGWVEHNASEIWNSQLSTMRSVLADARVRADQIAAIGITNQRETTVVWDRKTGKPVHNAIVWQDRRTASLCEELIAEGLGSHVKNTTGLLIDAYFSGTKISWILEHVEGARERARNGELAFGTIDSWLLYKLTGGRVHATEYSNAARTMLYDIRNLEWDRQLLDRLDIPATMLPEVHDSSADFGALEYDLLGADVSVTGIAGDQQAALFGQGCFQPGEAKNTYGTGCFMLMNTGKEAVASDSGLLTTIAWGIDGKVTYALEGSIFIAGAAVQWLRDGLGMIKSAEESEKLATSVDDNGGVFFVPAFTGLGTPYWDMSARGLIAGLTRGTTKAHLARATLESIAFQTRAVLDAMQKDSGIDLGELRVDGGATANRFLMQFQADLLGVPVIRPADLESTARGAAALAVRKTEIAENWKSADHEPDIFHPDDDASGVEALYQTWNQAIERAKGWLTIG